MRRRFLVLFGLAVFAAGGTVAGEETQPGSRVVELRIDYDDASLDGRTVVLMLTPEGNGVRLEDPAMDRAVRLVPSIQPTGTTPTIALEAQHIIRVNGETEAYNTVEVATIPMGDAVTLFGDEWPMYVEFVGIRTLDLGVALREGYGPTNLRPRECCVMCEGKLYCGFCVSSACGSCCT